MTRHRKTKDGFGQLAAAIDELRAVEGRIREIEDALTSGDALRLSTAPRPFGPRDLELRLVETALTIGGLAGRMNMRLGAIERALEGRGAHPISNLAPARGGRRLRLKPAPQERASQDPHIRLVPGNPPSRPN